MGDVVTGDFGGPRRRQAERRQYKAQESGESDLITPEKGPPPFDDEDERQLPYSPAAPPFTGEDVEDAGEPES
jgi:hypothetical protein